MKLHKNLVIAVIETLSSIFEAHHYADKVIEKQLKNNPRWGARDRAFIAEHSYEIVRWKRLLEYLIEDKQNYWHLFGIYWLWKNNELPNWSEVEHLKLDPEKLQQIQQCRALKESIPDWLDQVGANELKDEWNEILSSLNQTAPLIVRVNTLKINRETLKMRFAEEGIETSEIGESGLIVKVRRNLFLHPTFKEGLFEIQDANSQRIATTLDLKRGLTVVDACAGGGGKTLHMAALMENRGKIIALDTEAWKLTNLKQRARRAGAYNIETRWIENNKIIKRLYNSADRLLLDVPCSGLGVLRRNPDTKWKLTPRRLDEVRQTQQRILQNYAPICKEGGTLVYATCSVLPSENQRQIAQFLSDNPHFELQNEENIFPHRTDFDGFYYAILKKIK
jgi:16S rRNA (cytosine967-C5)-methyltransferase